MRQITSEVVRNGVCRGGNRSYESEEEREADIKALRKQGFDSLICYNDTNGPIALSYSKSRSSVYGELKAILHRSLSGDPTAKWTCEQHDELGKLGKELDDEAKQSQRYRDQERAYRNRSNPLYRNPSYDPLM